MEISAFRKVNFNAAHRLHNPRWDEATNQKIFGLCNNPNYHGHNYDLIVQITGQIDEETGYLIDLKVLKEIIDIHITSQLDHKNLNLDVPYFLNINPTAENISVFIWNRLRENLDHKYALKVKLFETERNFVEYAGA